MVDNVAMHFESEIRKIKSLIVKFIKDDQGQTSVIPLWHNGKKVSTLVKEVNNE